VQRTRCGECCELAPRGHAGFVDDLAFEQLFRFPAIFVVLVSLARDSAARVPPSSRATSFFGATAR
jgi:hypothetical protein